MMPCRKYALLVIVGVLLLVVPTILLAMLVDDIDENCEILVVKPLIMECDEKGNDDDNH